MTIDHLISNFPENSLPIFIRNFYEDFIKVGECYEGLFYLSPNAKQKELYSSIPQEYAENCYLLCINRGKDLGFVWHIYKDKPIEENPIVWLNSYYEGGVVANSFKEFLIVNCFHLNTLSIDWMYYNEHLKEGKEDNPHPTILRSKDETDQMIAYNIEKHPDFFPEYLKMLKEKYDIVPTDYYPVEIVGNAFMNNPNFIQWSIENNII